MTAFRIVISFCQKGGYGSKETTLVFDDNLFTMVAVMRDSYVFYHSTRSVAFVFERSVLFRVELIHRSISNTQTSSSIHTELSSIFLTRMEIRASQQTKYLMIPNKRKKI